MHRKRGCLLHQNHELRWATRVWQIQLDGVDRQKLGVADGYEVLDFRLDAVYLFPALGGCVVV